MKTRLLLFLAFCGLFAHAQNIEVSGLQSGIWDADTVFVTGDIKVENTLGIKPGTTVLFKDYFRIHVGEGASIKAVGDIKDSIVFTVADTTGFFIFDAGKGGWNGICLKNAKPSQFEYCRFQYGKATFDDDQDGGALRIKDCEEVRIGNSTLFCNFSREHGGALNAEWSKVTIHDCKVENNLTYTGLDTVYYMYGGGLRFLNCKVEITDTDFRYNNGQTAIGGALSIDSCAINIDRCRFEYNYGINGAGLYLIRCYDNPCSITNSLFARNMSGHFGGGLAICDSSPLVSNLTVVNNHSCGVNCGGIFFYQNSLPILRNCIIYGNTNEAQLEKPIQMWSWTFEGYAPEFYNCLVQYGFENITNHEIITVYKNCFDTDPLFADVERANYHLREDSPCINAGLTLPDDFNGYDLDKNPRVDNDSIDLGAYEYSTIGLNEITQNTPIRIVGNPISASSYAELALENEGELSAKVYSIDGRLLINKDFGHCNEGLNRLEIGEMFLSLPKGTYLMVFNVENQCFATKVVR